jgi:hypothetical protein
VRRASQLTQQGKPLILRPVNRGADREGHWDYVKCVARNPADRLTCNF